MRAIIFDLDGTLADSRAAILHTWRLCLSEAGLPGSRALGIAELVGLPLVECFERLLPELEPAARMSMVSRYRQLYPEVAASHERLFEGIVELLQTCRQAGLQLAIATGKSQQGALNSVRRLALQTRVDAVHGILPGTPGKPHPAVLERALAALQVEPEQALMVGDTEYDLHMAHTLGTPSCAVSWGVHSRERLQAQGPGWMCDSVAELEALIEGLLAT